MSAIADRSGVGKPTIYLRWANRAELMVAAVADLRSPVETDTSGGAREALRRSLWDDHEYLVRGEHGPFLRSVLFESVRQPALGEELELSILGPRRARLEALVSEGAGNGELRSDADGEAIADLLTGALIRAMVLGAAPKSAAVLRAYVDVVLDGIGTQATAVR